MSQITVTIPEWIFDHPEAYFLVIMNPDGTCEVDGAHSTPAGVAEAKRLIESLDCITKREGCRYMMIAVDEVPSDIDFRVDQDAIDALNKAHAQNQKAKNP